MRINQKGFTLVELLIALAVLAIVAVPVFSSMVLAARYTGWNDLQADCLRIAENELELQRAAKELNTVTVTVDGVEKTVVVPKTSAIDGTLGDAYEPGNPSGTVDGTYTTPSGIRITVTAEEIPQAEKLYAMTVKVEPPAREDGALPFDPVVLKGVIVYETVHKNTP